MRILGITGSPRGSRSTTRKLVESVLAGARESGAEVELIDLSEVSVDYCTACGACHVTGKCPLKDDFDSIRDKMLAADGLVLGSPLYFNSVTAQLKTALDRLSQPIHCQLYTGKYACSVASAGAPEPELATDYMNEILVRLGYNVVGSAGAAPAIPGSMDAGERDSVALGKDLVAAINERRTYPDQEAIHSQMRDRFVHLVTMNKDVWPYEYKHWQSKGCV